MINVFRTYTGYDFNFATDPLSFDDVNPQYTIISNTSEESLNQSIGSTNCTRNQASDNIELKLSFVLLFF